MPASWPSAPRDCILTAAICRSAITSEVQVRADFSQRVVVRPEHADWVASPQPGVERLMLDRIGGEIARATSIVRFAPGSDFPYHAHGGGEEVFVLDGVFEDELGRYPRGTYIRDPVGTAHAPFTYAGCTLFVKLWQFPPGDATRVVLDTGPQYWMRGGRDGVAVQPLHRFAGETTCLIRLAADVRLDRNPHPGGEEVLVLDGTFADEHDEYGAGTWIRNPPGGTHTPFTRTGCTLLIKTGHLTPERLALEPPNDPAR